MNQSGRPSRWRPSAHGPVRLVKSDGQFTPTNLFKASAHAARSKKSDEGFTAETCMAAGSLERPNIRNMSCNLGSCPPGYGSYGYDGTEWNYGSACTMYNNICVKNNYNKNDTDPITACCVGDATERDCDPSLCPKSQSCRDKMTAICDGPAAFNNERCARWMGASGNEDMKSFILKKQCTAEMMGSGPCRDFALDPASHGLIDATVTRWCTPGQIVTPSPVSVKLAEFTRWKTQNAPMPAWFMTEFRSGPVYYGYPSYMDDNQKLAAFTGEWIFKMGEAINKYGIQAVQNPKSTIRDNSQDKICACIASPLNKLGSAAAPAECFDIACRSGGYRTGTMKEVSQRCPSYTNCRASVAAIAGGTNERVNIQQICGGPPIVAAPAPGVVPSRPPVIPLIPLPLPSSQKDDKQLLLDDEARAAAAKSGSLPPVNVNITPGLADQLNKPFMPGQFGDMSIGSFGIMFFALIIISAILWRTWANRQSQDFAERLQAEKIQADQNLQNTGPAAIAIQEAVQAQMSAMPPIGATAR